MPLEDWERWGGERGNTQFSTLSAERYLAQVSQVLRAKSDNQVMGWVHDR